MEVNMLDPTFIGPVFPCLEWTGGHSRGYGVIDRDGKTRRLNRVTWIDEFGPIPDGLYVTHRCDNPPCYEITHLKLGTPKDNAEDRIMRGRDAKANQTHCKRGHPFDEANTYPQPSGGRDCRACKAIRQREYLARKSR